MKWLVVRCFRPMLAVAIAGGAAMACEVGCLSSVDEACRGSVESCSFQFSCIKGSEAYGCRFGPTCASVCETHYRQQYYQQCENDSRCWYGPNATSGGGCRAHVDPCASLSETQCDSNPDCAWEADPTYCWGVPTVTSCQDLSNSECAKVPGCSVQPP